MPKDTGKKLADMLYGQPFDVPTPENLRLGQQMIERELREKAARDAKLTPLDKAKAAYEAAKMMGSAAVAGLGSIPTRIVYGPEAAEKYVTSRISIPETEKGMDYVQNVGDFLEQLETKYKLPPIMPEAMALQHLTGPATKQATRAAKKKATQSGEKAVRLSDNPDVMQLELAGGGLVKGLAKAAKAKKASEVLGEFEGHPLLITQSDRTKVGGKWLGGPGFSGLQQTVPEYKQAEAAWGVAQPATAKTILGGYKQAKEQFGKEPLVTAMIGTPTQHQSNKMVFEELHRMFTKSAKEGNLDPDLLGLINDRLRNAVNKEGKNIFPEDVSILDKNFRKVADTFDKRAVASSVMGGTGVGGKKGQIIDYDAVIRHTTDPLLLDAPTGALGNRAFTLSGGLIDRPDLHPAFPSILQGEDIGQLFAPVPRELVMRDFIEKTMREKGRTPGFMDYTRGYPPTQLLTEDILTELQKKGYAQGGAVSYAEGGEITADDLILEERKL